MRRHAIVVAGAVLVAAAAGAWLWLNYFSVPAPPPVDRNLVDQAMADAIEEARAGVMKAPRSGNAWGRLGVLFLAHELPDEAAACFVQAERLSPEEPRWFHLHGFAVARRDPEAALRYYRRAVDLAGNSWDAPRVRLAELLLSLQRLDEAEAQLRLLLEGDANHARAHLGLARVALARQDFTTCLGHLDHCAFSPFACKAAHVLRAEIFESQGNPAAAAEEERSVAAFAPDAPWPDAALEMVDMSRVGPAAISERAARLAGQGRLRDSIAMLHEATGQYPDKDYLWLMLGQALIHREEFAEAEAACRSAAELSPQMAVTQYFLGVSLFGQKKYAEAAQCFRTASDLQPDYDLALFSLGESLSQINDQAGALGAYQAAIRCRPRYAAAHRGLGRLLALQGKKELARTHLSQAVEFDPADKEAKRWLEQLEKNGSLTKNP